ncbi:MAG TPA: T9SS type A sorting domain-containing protein [Ignavibacteria bacterium]|nr:T9SS type A sorting domain-containing protein [Ignavibacteria bacterium]HMR41989.1 T9SS type A sorting domain-containing protein [Ignavibacteria bacterium]
MYKLKFIAALITIMFQINLNAGAKCQQAVPINKNLYSVEVTQTSEENIVLVIFTVPDDCFVKINVTNTEGKTILELVNEEVPAGNYNVYHKSEVNIFNGKDKCVKATDITGVSKTYPVLAPDTYFSFNVFSDFVPPAISHNVTPAVPLLFWPFRIKSVVTDSIGIDSVWVKWYKNNPLDTKKFKLQNILDDKYEASFNSVNSDVTNGDSIFYRIFAQDRSSLHNLDSTSLNKITIKVLGLGQDFVSTDFPPQFWDLQFTAAPLWFRASASAFGSGTGSALFNFYNAEPGVNQAMVTNPFGESVAGDTLKFNHAYATYINEVDSLIIEISANSGISYSVLAKLTGGVSGSLVTAPPNQNSFIPGSSQWITKKYALPSGINMIRFRAVSAFGNNLYLDNICKVNGTTGISNYLNSEIPIEYSLSQNYPNPFNPVTRIGFDLKEAANVDLTIYDLLGRKINTIFKDHLIGGTHFTEFDGSDLPSGVYFYKIEARGTSKFVQTKRMVLLK